MTTKATPVFDPKQFDAMAQGLPLVVASSKAQEILAISEATLIRLAARGRVLTAVLDGRGTGKKGRRVYFTQSLLNYLRECAENTRLPKLVVTAPKKK